MVVTLCLPDGPDLCRDAVERAEDGMYLTADAGQATPPCPLYAQPATRIQSRYQRTLTELPWSAYVHHPVQLPLTSIP